MEDLKLSIPASDLPAPGEIVERVLNGFHILIESTAAPTEELGAPTPDEVRAYDGPLSWHEVVDVKGATRTHAALVRFFPASGRSRVNRYTLCSRTDSREVTGRRRDQQLATVTCAQCRRRLEDAGEL